MFRIAKLIAALIAAAALFAMIAPEQADTQSNAAATAASVCGSAAASSYRSLSSAKTTKSKIMLQSLCAKRHSKLTTVSFFTNHRLLVAPRYKFWQQVPDKKWRRTVKKSRQALRESLFELGVLSHRIISISTKLIYIYNGYTAPADARLLAKEMAAAKYGWTQTNGEWQCLDQLWGRSGSNGDQILESGWYMYADNPHSDAYGIPQALPGSKMGPRWRTSAWTQIRWGLSYILSSYQTPCNALNVRLAHGSY